MKLIQSFATTLAAMLALCGHAFTQAGTCSGMTIGQLTSLKGFVPFRSTSLWNTDISTAPVDPNSANYISFIGAAVTLHPDFGSGAFHNQSIGIPYPVVASTQAKVPVTLGAFADASDPGPEPIPSSALIEGYPKPTNSGDRHVLVLEKDGCWLYELYRAALNKRKWSDLIDPQAGPVRGTSTGVMPPAMTTYTLYSSNQFGRTTASVRVTVQ